MIPKNLYSPVNLEEHEKAKKQHLKIFYSNYAHMLPMDAEEKDENELAPLALKKLKNTLCTRKLRDTFPDFLTDLDTILVRAVGEGAYPTPALVLPCFKAVLLIKALCKEVREEQEQETIKRKEESAKKHASWKNLSQAARKAFEEKEAKLEKDLLWKQKEYANLETSLLNLLLAAVGPGKLENKVTLDDLLGYIQSFYFFCTTKEASHQLLEGFKTNHLLPELSRLGQISVEGYGICETGKLGTLNELLMMGRRDTNWISTSLHGQRYHVMRLLGIAFVESYRKLAREQARAQALAQGLLEEQIENAVQAAGMSALPEGWEVHMPNFIMQLADADGYGIGYVQKTDVYWHGMGLGRAIRHFYKENAPAYLMEYEKKLFSVLREELEVKIKQALKEQGIDLESWDEKGLVLSSKAHPTGGIINALHKILPLPEGIARELFKPLDQKEEEEEKDEVELLYRIKKKAEFFNLIGRQLKPQLQKAFPPSNEVPQALWDEHLKQLKLRTVEAFKTDLGIQLDDWEDQGLTFDAKKIPFDSIKKTLSEVIASLSNLPDFPPVVTYKPLPDYVLKEPLQKPEPQKNYQLKKKPEFLAVLRGILYRKQEKVEMVAAEVKEEANLEQIADDLRMQQARENSQKKLSQLEKFLLEKGINIEMWDSEVLSFTSKDNFIVKEIMEALELPKASFHLFEEPQEEFYLLPKKIDFFACLEEYLALHLVNEGYYTPFEKDPHLLRKQLETHKQSLLQNSQFLLKAIAKDPRIYCLLPDEIKKNHQFNRDFLNLLNAVFEKMFQEEELDEERLDTLTGALKEVLAFDPSYLSWKSLPCLLNPKAGVLKEKLISSNPLLFFRMAQDDSLQILAQKQNPLLRNIEASRLEYVEHMLTLWDFLESAPSFRETFSWMTPEDIEKDYLSFFYTLEQIKAVHQLTNSNNRLSAKQLITFAQTLTPSMLLLIMEYREGQGWEPLPACHKKALTQFNQALGALPRSLQVNSELFWNRMKTEKSQMKDLVQRGLSRQSFASQDRQALELLLHSPDWVSAYLQFQHNASFSPFENIQQFAAQLQYSATNSALLVASLFRVTLAIAMALLSATLYFLSILLIEVLLLGFILGYTHLFLWSSFILGASLWMNSLLHYNAYSFAVELLFPVLSLMLLIDLAVLAIPLTIISLELQGIILCFSPLIVMFLPTILDTIREDLDIVRGSLWHYCYKIASALPLLLSIGYAGGFLLTGTAIVAGLLAITFLSRQFSELENGLLKMFGFGHSLVNAGILGLVTIVEQLNEFLEWNSNLFSDNIEKCFSLINEIIFPLLSRSYETLFLKKYRLPETLTLACENRIAELCSMKGDLAAQEKGKLLDKIWKQIQADRKPAEMDNRPLPTLENLLHKPYPIEEGLEDGKKASFWQIAASRRTSTQAFEVEPEDIPVGYLDRGLRFFRGSTGTSNRIQAAINRALPEEQAELAEIRAIA